MTEHDIDWDCEVAKGCDWVLYSEPVTQSYFFYKNEPVITYNYWNGKRHLSVKHYGLLKRPERKDEPENIYTQGMFDAGELPKVGMKIYAEIQGDRSITDEVKIISISECENPVITFLRHAQCECIYWHNGVYFKPIKTRADKQKLADQIENFIIDKNINAIDTEELIDAIINGEFENLNFTGEK